MPQLFFSFCPDKGDEVSGLWYFLHRNQLHRTGMAGVCVSLQQGENLGHGAELFLFGISAGNYSVLLTNEYPPFILCQFEVAQVFVRALYFTSIWPIPISASWPAWLWCWRLLKKEPCGAGAYCRHIAGCSASGFNLLYMTGLVRTGFDLTLSCFFP